jgi:hypothetical protein
VLCSLRAKPRVDRRVTGPGWELDLLARGCALVPAGGATHCCWQPYSCHDMHCAFIGGGSFGGRQAGGAGRQAGFWLGPRWRQVPAGGAALSAGGALLRPQPQGCRGMLEDCGASLWGLAGMGLIQTVTV